MLEVIMMCGVSGAGKTTFAKQKSKKDTSGFRLMKQYSDSKRGLP